jgi:hypothetical protein
VHERCEPVRRERSGGRGGTGSDAVLRAVGRVDLAEVGFDRVALSNVPVARLGDGPVSRRRAVAGPPDQDVALSVDAIDLVAVERLSRLVPEQLKVTGSHGSVASRHQGARDESAIQFVLHRPQIGRDADRLGTRRRRRAEAQGNRGKGYTSTHE